MKKLLIILILFVSVANNAKAQTKEETITWLQEKLQKYLKFESRNTHSEDLTVTINECFITIKYNLNGVYGKEPGQSEMIPTSGVIIKEKFEMKNYTKSIKSRWMGKDSLTFESNVEVTMGEENLYERLQKAIDHLATFCPKTKETF